MTQPGVIGRRSLVEVEIDHPGDETDLVNSFFSRVKRNLMMGMIILIVIVSSFLSLSCINPFAPRLDTTPASLLCSDLTNLENVFCTFRQAYAFKDTSLYSSILANDFIFTYRDYDRGVDVTWGRTDDMHTTYGLFQNVQSLELIWDNIISESGDDTLRSVIRGFSLTVTFNLSDINRVDGYANLTFERPTSSDAWKIIRWRDESNY